MAGHVLTVGPDSDSDDDDFVGPPGAGNFGSFGYSVQVDFNGDGSFDSLEDIAADVLQMSGQRGRDDASQLTARSSPGRASLLLRNADGRYSPSNASGPNYGNLLNARKMRISMTDPFNFPIWTGFVDSIIPQAGGLPRASMSGTGVLGRFTAPASAKINPTPQTYKNTGYIVGVILDALSHPALARTIDTGDVEISYWYPGTIYGLDALREIEESEPGSLVYEDRNWGVTYESRYHRVRYSLTPFATLSDVLSSGAFAYQGISQDDALRHLFNGVQTPVSFLQSPGAVATLWQLTGETPTLGPGESRTFVADITGNSVNALFATSWVTPVVGADIVQSGVANGDLSVVVVTSGAETCQFTVTNNHVSARAALSTVSARAAYVVQLGQTTTISLDTASRDAYGYRDYPLPGKYFASTTYAQSAGDYFVSKQSSPRPPLTVDLEGYSTAALNMILTGDIGRRITIGAIDMQTRIGVSADYWIERISFDLPARGAPRFQWLLSPADDDPGYWILGTSALGVGTKLAY